MIEDEVFYRPPPGKMDEKFAIGRVFRASTVLNSTEKLVLLEVLYTDQGPSGSWYGATGLAKALGLGSLDPVHKARKRLKEYGILTKEDPEKNGTKAAWFARTPYECVPPSGKVELTEIVKFASRFDTIIREQVTIRKKAHGQHNATVRELAHGMTPTIRKKAHGPYAKKPTVHTQKSTWYHGQKSTPDTMGDSEALESQETHGVSTPTTETEETASPGNGSGPPSKSPADWFAEAKANIAGGTA